MKYVLKRVAQAAIVLLLTYTFAFWLLNVLPADPISLRFAESANPGSDSLAQLNAYYGFDQPLHVQYVTQLSQVLTGNLGYSLENGRPVAERIATALPATTALALLTLAIALVIAIALAVVVYSRWGSPVVKVVRMIPPITSALPVYWTGIVLIQIGSYQLGLFSALSTDGFPSLFAASLSLAIPISAAITQSLVTTVGEFTRAPFVEVARARGASKWRILRDYGIRFVAVPTLTVVAITFGTLMTSTIVTETVFSRTGVGSLVQRAVLGQDIPVVQGVVLLAALIYVATNLLVDIATLGIDPRLRALPATDRARRRATAPAGGVA